MQPAHTARSTTLDELPYDSGLIETKGALMARNMLDPKIVTESEIRELPLFIKIYGGLCIASGVISACGNRKAPPASAKKRALAV